MSHSVTISVELNEYDKEEISVICEDAINKIKNIWISDNLGIKELIDKKIKELKVIEENKNKSIFISENSDSKLALQIYKDKIIKEISNFYTTINSKEFYKAFKYTENNMDLSNWINKYGTTTLVAISNLKEQNKTINDENISKEIDEIININSTANIKNELNKQITDNIEKIFSFDKNLKFSFKNNLNHLNSYQELNDYNIFINSKEYTYKKMIHLQKIVMEGIKKIRRYYLNSPIEKKLNDDNQLVFIYHLKNNLGETFDLKIDENLHLTYKIGDYRDHCCEATSQKLWNYLEKNKAKIISKNIIREFNNQKPLYKSINKMYEKKEKNK